MAKRRVTVDNDHLTLVVRKRLFGYARNVVLVSRYKKSLEEVVLTSETYYNHETAVQRATELGEQLNVKVAIEQ